MKYRIPERITSDRLILRKPMANDWEELHRYYSDENSMRYTIGHALEDWETWRNVALMIGHWEIRQYGPYVMEISDKVIGVTGLWFPYGWPEPEIKWGLLPDARGDGYAREGAEAVLLMAAQYLPDLHLISLIHPDNQNSVKVATGIGAVYEKTIPFRGEVAAVYRHKK